MGKTVKKGETMTIRVTTEVKKRADTLWERSGTADTRSAFYGDLVALGAKVQERIEDFKDETILNIAEKLNPKKDEGHKQQKIAR
jgi:hypothetical protein